MLNKLKIKSDFNRNVLVLMTGTTIAQAIPIVLSPLLTRLYTPEDFGLFAVFISIVSIISVLMTGCYEYAIMLPENDEDAINIFTLGLIINIFMFLIILLLVLIFGDFFSKTFFKNDESGLWILFVPITVFFIGLFNLLNYFNTRLKCFKDIANANIIKSVILAIIQIMLGLLKKGATGLITGHIVSQFFANLRLLKNIIRDKSFFAMINKDSLFTLSKRYVNFPKFTMPAMLLNISSQQVTNLLVSSFFSTTTLGFYSIAQRILGMPSFIIGRSIGQVFFEEATKEKHKTGKAINIFKATIKKLVLIAFPTFLALFFIVVELFAFVFGEPWRIAGEYAQILIPFFFIQFISSTLSMVLVVFEKQKNELIINIILITTSMIAIISFNDFKFFLYFFSSFMCFNYTLFLIYYYWLVGGFKK